MKLNDRSEHDMTELEKVLKRVRDTLKQGDDTAAEMVAGAVVFVCYGDDSWRNTSLMLNEQTHQLIQSILDIKTSADLDDEEFRSVATQCLYWLESC